MMNTYFGTVDAWLAIIRGEYVEVPGLQLTRDQVKRMPLRLEQIQPTKSMAYYMSNRSTKS